MLKFPEGEAMVALPLETVAMLKPIFESVRPLASTLCQCQYAHCQI